MHQQAAFESNSDQLIYKLFRENANLIENELIIHRDYGLGKFLGLETITNSNISNDYLKIQYADNSILFVPIEDFEVISRYGEFNELIKLDSLGSIQWSVRQKKVKRHIQKIVDELIKLASQRQVSKAPILVPNEGEYNEFCQKFPYKETQGQSKSIREIEDDLAKGIPMDRLICGDVGFGKTEVALRAVFIATKSLKNSGQVAIVAPTTLLCRQHYKVFKERFENTDLKIAQLSRMVSKKEALEVKKGLENGTIDIVVGTHALLSESVKFKNINFLIIDEEQRFGVKQKEKLKQWRTNIHVLTLSATPIPRTLQMSMSGIRDLSIIATPPVARLPIKTFVEKYNEDKIKFAIEREVERKGRVFFVVPRIEDISKIECRLKAIMPEVKFEVAHGRMCSSRLEEIMSNFYDGKFDVLISTVIVESGLDVKTANTMIVYRANMFGLAQLYQLRGRVGRGKEQAYAYLTTKLNDEIGETAKKRLEIMSKICGLGGGFSLASSDMDIRGSGNLVGDEQSGHIKEIGVELYNYLLKEAVGKARAKAQEKEDEQEYTPQVKLNFSTIIPSNYIQETSLRIYFYRKIAAIQNQEQKEYIEIELEDRFGEIPEEVNNLLEIELLKIRSKKLGILKLELKQNQIIITFFNNKFSNPDSLMKFIMGNSNNVSVKEGNKVCFKIETINKILETKRVLESLEEL